MNSNSTEKADSLMKQAEKKLKGR